LNYTYASKESILNPVILREPSSKIRSRKNTTPKKLNLLNLDTTKIPQLELLDDTETTNIFEELLEKKRNQGFIIRNDHIFQNIEKITNKKYKKGLIARKSAGHGVRERSDIVENSADLKNKVLQENNLSTLTDNENEAILNNPVRKKKKRIKVSFNSVCIICKWNFPKKMTKDDKNIHMNYCLEGNGDEHKLSYLHSFGDYIPYDMNNYEKQDLEQPNNLEQDICPLCSKPYKNQSFKFKNSHITNCLRLQEEEGINKKTKRKKNPPK
jgi:hypothetical protein